MRSALKGHDKDARNSWRTRDFVGGEVGACNRSDRGGSSQIDAARRSKFPHTKSGGPMAADKINFPHMFFLPATSPADEAWEPRVDIHRTPDGWLIKFELAGVKLDDIRVVADSHTLLVQGRRRDEHCFQGMGCHCMEIAYSQFRRVLALPGLPAAPEMMMSYVDGMLLVRIKAGGKP
jgi:HSP20 family protein